jgi:DinB superfamily
MARRGPVARLLADMVYDTAFGSPWHKLAEATEGIAQGHLSYRPAKLGRPWHTGGHCCIISPRLILKHTADAAAHYGPALGDRTDDPSEAAWDAVDLKGASRDAGALVGAVDVALRRLNARTKALRDADLVQPTRGVWPGALKGQMVIDGAMLHTAWHLGQVAMLIGWCDRDCDLVCPQANASAAPPYPFADAWAPLDVSSRAAACLTVLETAYRQSPLHSIRPTLQGMTPGELTWSPFPDRWGPMIAIHVAHCKVIYADHAFGDRSLGWGDVDRLIGSTWRRPTAAKLVAAMDRAHEFLVERVAQATDGDLSRVNPMHHNVPMTGWQVVACMAQHDAWHGGQIAIMRDVYDALAEGAPPRHGSKE